MKKKLTKRNRKKTKKKGGMAEEPFKRFMMMVKENIEKNYSDKLLYKPDDSGNKYHGIGFQIGLKIINGIPRTLLDGSIGKYHIHVINEYNKCNKNGYKSMGMHLKKGYRIGKNIHNEHLSLYPPGTNIAKKSVTSKEDLIKTMKKFYCFDDSKVVNKLFVDKFIEGCLYYLLKYEPKDFPKPLSAPPKNVPRYNPSNQSLSVALQKVKFPVGQTLSRGTRKNTHSNSSRGHSRSRERGQQERRRSPRDSRRLSRSRSRGRSPRDSHSRSRGRLPSYSRRYSHGIRRNSRGSPLRGSFR